MHACLTFRIRFTWVKQKRLWSLSDVWSFFLLGATTIVLPCWKRTLLSARVHIHGSDQSKVKCTLGASGPSPSWLDIHQDFEIILKRKTQENCTLLIFSVFSYVLFYVKSRTLQASLEVGGALESWRGVNIEKSPWYKVLQLLLSLF